MKKQTPKEKEYNRMAMAKVRADVRQAMTNGMPEGMAHLGDYPRTMEDAVRTIIALQDMLEDSMTRHKKATNMVVEYKEATKAISEMVEHLSIHAIQDSIGKQQHIGQLSQLLERERIEHMATAEALQNAHIEMQSVQMEQTESDDQLNAAMVTLRTALNQGHF